MFAACSDSRPPTHDAASASSAPGPAPFTGPDFYAVPDPLPEGRPGDLIRYQAVDAPTLQHATVWRVMYHSRSLRDADIAVTGLISVPSSDAPASGREIVSWAHGTVGLADVCAPSKKPDANVAGVFATPFLDEGRIVAATDYEGLGTPGVHPYIVGVSEARGVIDIVRAARQLPDAHAGTRYAVWGHSQGGHAALFADQIASTWALELQLVGTVAAAPATELPLLSTLLRLAPNQALAFMVAGGWHAGYPDADLHLVLTDAAIAKLDVVDQGCSEAVAAAVAGMSFTDVVKADPASVEPWKQIGTDNDPGHVRSDSPLFIVHGSADTLIPALASELLRQRLCGLGQVVSRKVYDGSTHGTIVGTAFSDIKQWIDERFAGAAATSTC